MGFDVLMKWVVGQRVFLLDEMREWGNGKK